MGLTDAEDVERLLDWCISAGLVEDRDGDVHSTRAWNARLQQAAEVLNRQAGETGYAVPGHPIEAAVRKALAMHAVAVPGADEDNIVRVLTLVELSAMTEAKRAQYGRYP